MIRRRPHSSAGFSLVEVLLVLTIVAVVMGTVVMSFRSLRRASAKAVAGQLAAAIRYTYDRAITTGAYYRMVFDLDPEEGGRYWAEKSDTRHYIVRGKEKGDGRGRGPDEEKEEKERKEKEQRERGLFGGSTTGTDVLLEPPPEPKRAQFEAFQDSNLPKVKLGDAKVKSLYTRRQSEPYVEGRGYLYFFPDGHTERAIIHVGDSDGDIYSLIVHPLTGRVEVKAGAVEPTREFDLDAEGRSVEGR